jgi:hypothetical protein
MRKSLAAIFVLLFTPVACGQSSVTFPSYMSGLPAASTPLTGTEPLIVMQGGNVLQTPVTSVFGLPNFILNGVRVAVLSSSATTVNLTTSNYFICLNPTANAITVNLPAGPTTGQSYLIKDCTGQAGNHSITVTPAAGNIDGQANFILGIPYQSSAVTYTGSQWSIN